MSASAIWTFVRSSRHCATLAKEKAQEKAKKKETITDVSTRYAQPYTAYTAYTQPTHSLHTAYTQPTRVPE